MIARVRVPRLISIRRLTKERILLKKGEIKYEFQETFKLR